MKITKRVQLAAIAISASLFAGAALANPPKPNVFDGGNLWYITYYNDPTTNHQQWATQGICFLPYAQVGTSIQGVWYSTTFPDWNGRYYQEGDEVKMTGDYAKDVGHDHMTLLHTTYDVGGQVPAMAFKDWTEWREDSRFGRIIGWGNAKLQRAGKCAYPRDWIASSDLTAKDQYYMELETDQLSKSLAPRLTANGEIATYPGQNDLESVETYLKRSNNLLTK